MERMEVDQGACAVPGGSGSSLRRSNSAPMITNLSDSAAVFQPTFTRCRRSSVSVNLSCPGLEETMAALRRDAAHGREVLTAMQTHSVWEDNYRPTLHMHDGGITPNSSPSPTRRFTRTVLGPSVRSAPIASLKRKGGIEMDSPPSKLFVAGVPGGGNPEVPPLGSASSESLDNARVGSQSPQQTAATTVPPIAVTVTLAPPNSIDFAPRFIPAPQPPGM
nr:PREDICTED: protein FAM122A-like [Latimeria chalumnae]|eukprot:XP_006013102.2 PREDICTED: protein FAM122A-like [Latimeria chalumnae]